MSFSGTHKEIMHWAWNQDVTPEQKLVLLNLAMSTKCPSGDGETFFTGFPPINAIVDLTGLTEKQVLRACMDLTQAGLLVEDSAGRLDLTLAVEELY